MAALSEQFAATLTTLIGEAIEGDGDSDDDDEELTLVDLSAAFSDDDE